MCYYIIQNIIETYVIRSQAPPPKIWEVEPRCYSCDPGTSAPAHGMPSRLHHVTVSRGQIMAPALACARTSLSRCVLARAVRSPEKGIHLEVYVAQGYRTRSLPVALSHADLQSHARESEIA